MSARRLWSFFLLGVYSLILLHDFIPHTHQDVETGKKVHAAIQYLQSSFSDSGTFNFSQKKGETTCLTAESGDMVQHSSKDGGHHHDLSYKLSNESKRSWQTVLVCQVIYSYDGYQEILHSKPPASTGFVLLEKPYCFTNGLRGPPSLA